MVPAVSSGQMPGTPAPRTVFLCSARAVLPLTPIPHPLTQTSAEEGLPWVCGSPGLRGKCCWQACLFLLCEGCSTPLPCPNPASSKNANEIGSFNGYLCRNQANNGLKSMLINPFKSGGTAKGVIAFTSKKVSTWKLGIGLWALWLLLLQSGFKLVQLRDALKWHVSPPLTYIVCQLR